MRPTLLVVQNAEWEGPGLIETHAKAACVDIVIAKLFGKAHAGAIPFKDIRKGYFCAVVALGSPSTAYLPKSNPHHSELVRLFRLVRRMKIPSFNVCYSMQLFCLAHGGSVVKNPLGKEVGFIEVQPTQEGRSDPVIGSVAPYTTLQWHGDIVDRLPRGAVRLAYSKLTNNQVAVLDGIHYLLQSDGQAATPMMVRSWLRHDAAWATKDTGVRGAELVREASDREAYFRNGFFRVFANFLSLALEPHA